jgi:hypothetical protein
MYKILSDILVSGLTPYADKIIGDHQCGFWYDIFSTNQIFCICQIPEKKWEYNGTVDKLFMEFEKTYDSVRRVLYNILTECGMPMKLVMIMKMCSTKTYSKVCIGKKLSDAFPIVNGLK